MDPQACLLRIFDALNAGELEEAEDALDDLTAWLSGGGFMPKLDSDMLLTLLMHTRNDVTAQRREEEAY